VRINDFDDSLDPVILKRGRQYYQEGRVSRIEKTTAGWTAVVAGTHDYRVEVQLEPNGFIRFSSCDCPYEGGEYCKHQAAVFYALRAGVTTGGPGGQETMATGPMGGLEKVLTDMEPGQMRDIILDETRALFQAHIERSAREADQRSKYKQVCVMIKTYKKACGELAARSMITELCRLYPRRPAFLDELGRI